MVKKITDVFSLGILWRWFGKKNKGGCRGVYVCSGPQQLTNQIENTIESQRQGNEPH